jgi:hypothetical protein
LSGEILNLAVFLIIAETLDLSKRAEARSEYGRSVHTLVQERCPAAPTDVVINVKATYGSIEVLIADARAWDFFGSPTDLVGTSIQHRF